MRLRSTGLVAALALSALTSSTPARATLTDSEKGRVRDFYARGEAVNAPIVRALLARPDLSQEEASDAFSEAARRVTFDDAHASFVRDLLFGPASQASRSDLLPSVVRGLLARSAEVAGASGRKDTARADELLRIHRFILHEVATASAPREGESGGAALRPDALKAVVAAYREHLALPVLDRARLEGPLTVARTEAELAMIGVSAGVASTADVAAWINAGPTQREALAKTGVLVVGLRDAPPAKTAEVEALVEAVPAATRDASALWIGKPWPRGLEASRRVLVAEAPLASDQRVDAARAWPSAVEPSSPGAAIAEIAFVLGRSAAHAIMKRDGGAEAVGRVLARARAGGDAAFLAPAVLAEALDRDATGGTDAAIAPEGFLAHAVRQALLDAPRSVSLALVRQLVGRSEPAEQLALALGTIADDGEGKLRASATVFRPVDGGGLVPLEVTKLRGSPLAVEGFTLDGHAYSFVRSEGGVVERLERDGKLPTLATIPFARIPTTAGETWTTPGKKTLRRLFGKPEVGFADDGAILVRSDGVSKGFDAVAMAAPASTLQLDADVRVVGAPGAIVLRASAGPSGYLGVALFIEPGDAPRAELVAFDAAGKTPLTDPTPLAAPGPKGHRVHVALGKDRIQVTIGSRKLSAKLPDHPSGDVAFAPGDRGDLELRALRVRR